MHFLCFTLHFMSVKWKHYMRFQAKIESLFNRCIKPRINCFSVTHKIATCLNFQYISRTCISGYRYAYQEDLKSGKREKIRQRKPLQYFLSSQYVSAFVEASNSRQVNKSGKQKSSYFIQTYGILMYFQSKYLCIYFIIRTLATFLIQFG